MALVLIVEDEALLRSNASEILAEAGHQTIEAANAHEALVILEGRPDVEVVFSDNHMPGALDGLRLLNLVARRWPSIRLILTSGRGLPSDELLPFGGIFLPKPYSYENVASLIARGSSQ
jgi:CheY-like chemotaxis protein